MTDAKHNPTQDELDAFILAAGFRFGWLNLETNARRIVEHAIAERTELLEALVECLQSLDYVAHAHPEVTGIAKRQRDIARARAAIAKTTGSAS